MLRHLLEVVRINSLSLKFRSN